MIDVKEKKILQLLFSEEAYSEEEISALLRGTDIDGEKIEFLLLLALLGNKQNWQFFPQSLRPRLEGIYKSVRLRNIYGVPWLNEKLLLLKQRNIPVLFLKGMAMRAYYAPHLPRQMSDFDLAVPEDRFEEARKCLMESDTFAENGAVSLHAQHIQKQGKTIDLHKWIFKTHGEAASGLWEKAVTTGFNGTDVMVLNPVDMFIHVIDCKARDLIKNIQTERKVKWLLDVRSVLGKTGLEYWNWEEVAVRAGETGSSHYLAWLMPVFSEVFPDILTERDRKKFFPQDRTYEKWHKKVMDFCREHKEYRAYIKTRDKEKHRVRHFLRSMKYSWTAYHCYYGPELERIDPDYGFWKYFCETRHADGVPSLLKRYAAKFVKLVKK